MSSKKHVAPVGLLETLKAIDNGTLTPFHSLERCLERIKECEMDIHAFSALNGHAPEHAETAKGPLAGIAFGVKDIYDTADLPTEFNSPIYRNHQPLRDASLVAAARASGGTLLGKTVTTEFAFLDPGATRNPHNLEHTPGGSSSGSAAAVAAGMVHLAFGSQTGGSVIRPASFCGVTGFKPSTGLLPKVGMKDFSWSLDTAGLFAKTVEDCAYAASVLAGRNLKLNANADIPLPKLGIVRSHAWPEADEDYRKKFDALLQSLGAFGAELVEIEPSTLFVSAFHAHQIIQDYEALRALAWEYKTHPNDLSPLLKQTLDFARTITASDYDEAHICAASAQAETEEHFEDVDVFISLSSLGPAPRGLTSTGSPIFNRIWSLFGMPSINVTGLQSTDGLPLGIQIVGPVGEDLRTLHIAHWLEGAIYRHLHR